MKTQSWMVCVLVCLYGVFASATPNEEQRFRHIVGLGPQPSAVKEDMARSVLVLVPTREPNKEETTAYSKALAEWKKGADPHNVDPLLAFLEKNENSPWKASASLILGLAYKDCRRPQEAIDALRVAGKLYDEVATTRKGAQALVDWALVEAADLEAKKGSKGDFVRVANRINREMTSAQVSSAGGRKMEYDAENRLVSVTVGTHRSEFGYDGFGRCVQIKELDQDTQGVFQVSSSKTYLWDGMQMVQERDATGAVVLKQFFDQGFVDSDGTILYYTRDHLGSIRELTDSQQNVRARYDYDPWGRATKVTGDKDSPFLYTGHFWHASSGLCLTLFRAYDPNLGRWITRDPIQEEGGINLYRYVSNNPINKVDPLGLDECDDLYNRLSAVCRKMGELGGFTREQRNACWRDAADQMANCIRNKNRKCSSSPFASPVPSTAPDPSPVAETNWKPWIIGGAVVLIGGAIIITGGAAAPLALAL